MDPSKQQKPAGIILGKHLAGTLSAPSTNLHMTCSQVQQTNLSSRVLMFDKIVIGSIILKLSKLLLLKHAAYEIYYPNVFELPSGIMILLIQLWLMHWHERLERRQVSRFSV
jgi:hypothetical protein